MNSSDLMHHFTVDCVVFGMDSHELNVLLVQREFEDPDKLGNIIKDYKFPGNFVSFSEDLDVAALRVLRELTGISDIYLEQFKTFGSLTRLSNPKDRAWLKTILPIELKRILTVAYFALIPIEKAKQENLSSRAFWFKISDLPTLPFDHPEILKSAQKAVLSKLYQDPVVYELLPEKFTLTQLQKSYEGIIGQSLDKRNFRKRVSNLPYLISLNQWQQNVAHKPAQLYRFSKNIYEQTKKDNLYFST